MCLTISGNIAPANGLGWAGPISGARSAHSARWGSPLQLISRGRGKVMPLGSTNMVICGSLADLAMIQTEDKGILTTCGNIVAASGCGLADRILPIKKEP